MNPTNPSPHTDKPVANKAVRPKTHLVRSHAAGRHPTHAPWSLSHVWELAPATKIPLLHTHGVHVAHGSSYASAYYEQIVEESTVSAGSSASVELLRDHYQSAIKTNAREAYRDIIKELNHLAKQPRVMVGTAVIAALDVIGQTGQIGTHCEDLASKLQSVHNWVQTLPKNSGLHNLYDTCSNICDQRGLGDFTVS